MKYEELKTPVDVMAAFSAGRRVRVIFAESVLDGDASMVTLAGVVRSMRDGVCYRALIEEPETPADSLGRAADGVEGPENVGEMDRTAPPKVWLQIDPAGDADVVLSRSREIHGTS